MSASAIPSEVSSPRSALESDVATGPVSGWYVMTCQAKSPTTKSTIDNRALLALRLRVIRFSPVENGDFWKKEVHGRNGFGRGWSLRNYVRVIAALSMNSCAFAGLNVLPWISTGAKTSWSTSEKTTSLLSIMPRMSSVVRVVITSS